MKADHTVKK